MLKNEWLEFENKGISEKHYLEYFPKIILILKIMWRLQASETLKPVKKTKGNFRKVCLNSTYDLEFSFVLINLIQLIQIIKLEITNY